MLRSGTWIPGLYSILKTFDPELEIVNLTKGNVKTTLHVETPEFCEWIIPQAKKMNPNVIRHISEIINSERPDVIQVWGTEDFWGMFPFRHLFPEIPVIIEIQGILASVSEEYYGGLLPWELFRCWNIKECLKPTSSLYAIRRLYSRNVNREAEILRLAENIGVQSLWSADVVRTFNPDARLYKSGIALRPAFYDSMKWTPSSDGEVRVFSTALMGQPLKGCFTLFKAFAIVKKQFPQAKLFLGGVKETGIRRSGFCRMLTKYAERNGFADSIVQLGPLTAEQLAEQYRMASVFVNPSNWESYSVVTAEAQYIGCPIVAAYSGAMPELGVNNSILYFPKGDFRICAARIMDILSDATLAKNLSSKSIIVAEIRQNPEIIAKSQIDTYNHLVNTKKLGKC